MIGEKFINKVAGEWYARIDRMASDFLKILQKISDQLEFISNTLIDIESKLEDGFDYNITLAPGEGNSYGNGTPVKNNRDSS